MAQNSNPAGIVYARNSYCDFMVRGNEALTNRRPEVAIQYYTKVLYELSPGDVCAFLNRSIAYVCEGYGELAVTDAYRALLAARAMNHRTRVTNTRLDQVVQYIDVERSHVATNKRWTLPQRRNIGTHWLAAPLASVVINALPGIPPLVARPQNSTSARASLCRALELCATYRLCGALSKLGEGARMDALGLIDNIKSKFGMAGWESCCFDKLGNDIMLQVVAEVDPWEPKDIIALGHDTKAARDERMKAVKEKMRAASTTSGYGDYHWDRYEPKLGEDKWARRVQSWVEAHSQNCSAVVIQPEEAADSIDDLKPYVELRAKRDINPGEIILSVLSIINLATSTPEKVQARRDAGFVDQYYCNSCASLLVVPRECTKRFEKRIVPSTGANPTEHPELRSSVPSSLAPSSAQDFMFCHPTHMVPTCSAACRGLGRDFDHGLCHTNLEQKIRESHLNDIYPRSMTDRNTQCLRDLIFVRLIARAINLGKNPLGSNNIMFATSGPDMRDIEYEETEHWTFASHVMRPLRYLEDLFRKHNTDQFQRLAQVDGWMINTLLLKISRVINVSQSPRYVKYFRPDGMLDTAFGPDDDRWTHVPKEPEDQPTWIASIDSLAWLIGVADPATGETPNVTIVRRESVHVYAAKAIKAGEPLLRAANGAESPSQEEVEIAAVEKALEMLDQLSEMQNAQEQQDRMNESGDTKEPHDQTDEMNDVEEDLSETKVDLEQYFDALDEERRNAEESQDQMDEQSTDSQEPPSQSHEMGSTAEDHSESESRVDLEQYFDALDEERRNAELLGKDRMDDSSDAEEESSGPRADLEGSFEGGGEEVRAGGAGVGGQASGYGGAGVGEESGEEVIGDAMVFDGGMDGHGHGARRDE